MPVLLGKIRHAAHQGTFEGFCLGVAQVVSFVCVFAVLAGTVLQFNYALDLQRQSGKPWVWYLLAGGAVAFVLCFALYFVFARAQQLPHIANAALELRNQILQLSQQLETLRTFAVKHLGLVMEKETDTQMRIELIGLLAQFGQTARETAPILIRLLNDPQVSDFDLPRAELLAALKQIDPEGGWA